MLSHFFSLQHIFQCNLAREAYTLHVNLRASSDN